MILISRLTLLIAFSLSLHAAPHPRQHHHRNTTNHHHHHHNLHRRAQAVLDIGLGLEVDIANAPIAPPTYTSTRIVTIIEVDTATITSTHTLTRSVSPPSPNTFSPAPTTSSAVISDAQLPEFSPSPQQTRSVLFSPPPLLPTPSVPEPIPTPTTQGDRRPLVAAYYPDWAGWTLPPEAVDFNRFDWVDFAFAIPTDSFSLVFTQDNSEELLFRLVAAAHSARKHVKLSIGGWTGSAHFSNAVATPESRATFARNILALYTKFALDGIDLDWEYPGVNGAPGNTVSPADSSNYLAFLRVLRATLPPGAVITAATQVWPFADWDGRPMRDVSAYADIFDWILIMNYDVWGSSATPGPNAPLSDACGNSSQPLANAAAAIRSWTDAGFPASQLTLGVPSYGYLSRSSALKLVSRGDDSVVSGVTVRNDWGGTDDGQVQFAELVRQGALRRTENGAYVGAGGFERRWDECSSTPFLRSESSGQIITYDDPTSLRLKAELARETGIRGINIFDAHGDTGSWELIDAVRQGLGVTQ